MGDFIRRLWVAVILVPILVVGLFVDPSPWSILVMSAIATMFAHDEFLRMSLPVRAEDGEWPLRLVVVGLLGGAIHSLPMIWTPGTVLPPLLSPVGDGHRADDARRVGTTSSAPAGTWPRASPACSTCPCWPACGR